MIFLLVFWELIVINTSLKWDLLSFQLYDFMDFLFLILGELEYKLIYDHQSL